MPPSGWDEKTKWFLLGFVRGNYKNLLDTVRSGKFKTYEEAIEYEIAQTGKAMDSMHINKKGRLVNRRH
ncbi:MAG: hypothetical protein ABSB00_01565 [Minisyncoccia bacterium]|jgi:hypothetical protein